MKRVFALSLIIIAIVTSVGFLIAYNSTAENTQQKKNAPIYVGVTFCGNTTDQGKLLVDRVEPYTNLLIIDSIVLNKNESALTNLSNYIVARGLHLIVYFSDFNLPWQLPWVKTTQERLGDMFLGVYYYDEPGGIQLDFNWQNNSNTMVPNFTNTTRNYDLAAATYISNFQNYPKFKALRNMPITTFTSDYALYWFDYKAGFDVVLTQFGWNHSITQEIDLSRAAAQTQNKTWGAIITWKYNESPYLDTPDNIYDQMLLAYQSGAKYISIFNYPTYPEGNAYGVMTDGHFEALQKFWNHITSKTANNSDPDVSHPETALVLPQNYAFGFRNPNDRIWGFWGPDELSPQIWNVTQTLLAKYGLRLDIVYDDPDFPVTGRYTKIYMWNQTVYD